MNSREYVRNQRRPNIKKANFLWPPINHLQASWNVTTSFLQSEKNIPISKCQNGLMRKHWSWPINPTVVTSKYFKFCIDFSADMVHEARHMQVRSSSHPIFITNAQRHYFFQIVNSWRSKNLWNDSKSPKKSIQKARTRKLRSISDNLVLLLQNDFKSV